MVNPTPGYSISTPYKKRGKYWSLDQAGDPLKHTRRGNNGRPGWGIHTGADMAGGASGARIVSATPGKVIAANAYDKAYGYKVIVRWGKYDVWYCHMPKGRATVRVGQTVKAGQQIGVVGATGNVSGAHLHLELRTAGGGFTLSSFHNPSIAINYSEDWFSMATEAELRKIIREEIERLVKIDNVPIYEPTRTPEQLAKDPTARWGSVLGSTLSKVDRVLNILEKNPQPEPEPNVPLV